MARKMKMLCWILFTCYGPCLAWATQSTELQKGEASTMALIENEELQIPLSEKGLSGPVPQGLSLNAETPSAKKQAQPIRNENGALDEPCLPADSLVIQWLSATTMQLRWHAPQSGTYRVYRTDLPNHAVPPTAPDWVLISTQTTGLPATMTFVDLTATSEYRNYVVIHECTAPENNNCANAMLVGDGVHYYSTLGATTDGPSTACSGNNLQNDIWFKYVATCDIFSIRLCERANNWDAMVTVYNGWNCPAANSEIECDDDGCYAPFSPNLGARVTVQGVAGQQYLIRVGGFFGATGTGNMKIAPGADNDECGESRLIQALAGQTYLYPFTNVCANTDGPPESFTSGFPPLRHITGDLWYELKSTACGVCTLKTCGSNFDTQIAVYDSNLCPEVQLTAHATNDDACGVSSRLAFRVENQSHYLIRVGGYPGATGSGTLTVVMPTPPANDLCSNAQIVGLGQYSFSTINACTDGPVQGPWGPAMHDVWFETSVALCSFLEVDVCDVNFDTWIEVYEGNDCLNLGAPIASNDDTVGCPNSDGSMVRFYPTSSGPYLIRVGGFGPLQVGTGVLNISQGFIAYSNESCTSTQSLTYGTHTIRNNCASNDGEPVTCGQIYNDLWFTISPPLNSTTTVSLCGSESDTRLAVYYSILSPACDNLSLVVCGDNECGDDAEVSFGRGGIALGTYLVRVGGASVFEEGLLQLNIELQ
jgi:hypothetical protein